MIAAHRAETPEREAESAVWVEAEGDVPAGVQLALQLHGAAQGSRGGVRHLDTSLGWRSNVEMKHVRPYQEIFQEIISKFVLPHFAPG